MLLHYLQGLAPHAAMQIDQARFERLDEDGINAILYERNRNRSITDILDDLHRTHAQVLAALEPMTYDDLMKPLYADDPQKRPLIGWVIGNTYEHYQEHRKVIQTTTDE
jgi:hypothetical protein